MKLLYFALAAGVCLLDRSSQAGSVDQVRAWINLLSQPEREQALQAFNNPERKHVNWFPGSRLGLPLRAMPEETRKATRALLRSLLSPTGYAAVETVLEREAVLQKIERAPEFRDPSKYYLAVFGSPGPEYWGVRFEGHHLSVNLTYRGDDLLSFTPLFLGSNPDEIAPPAQPTVFLRPLLDLAAEISGPEKSVRAIKVSDLPRNRQEMVRQILDFYYAIAPEPTRSRLEPQLATRVSTFSYQDGAITIEGNGIHYSLQPQARLHFHSLLRDDRADFGGT